ncbi:MAG: hypothetical protein ABSB56_06970 [Nitrososphaerales archaeon]
MEPSSEPVPNPAGSALAAFFLVLLSLTALLVVLSFPVGLYTVFFTHLSNSTASTLGQPFLWLGPVAVLLPFQVTYGAAFTVVIAVYLAMFVLTIFQGESLPSAVLSGLRNGYREFLSNRALLTLVAIGFLVFTAGLLDEVVSAVGAPIGNPFSGGNDLLTFVELALAPLREEFGFRVLLIGLAAVLVTLSRPGTSVLKTLWRPSVAYEGVDNNTVVLVAIWVAGALSAGTFGACHVACGGGGWDIGKLPEAVYGGVALSYLYIRYGFHVAVLAHWGIDYLPSVFAFYGEGAYGIPWGSTPGYLLQQIVAVDLFEVFGIACLLGVAYIGAVKLLDRRREPPLIPA